MPVKNEEWILPTTLEDLSRYIDDLVVCDGSDEDNSRVVIKKYGGHLISESNRSYIRAILRLLFMNFSIFLICETPRAA